MNADRRGLVTSQPISENCFELFSTAYTVPEPEIDRAGMSFLAPQGQGE